MVETRPLSDDRKVRPCKWQIFEKRQAADGLLVAELIERRTKVATKAKSSLGHARYSSYSARVFLRRSCVDAIRKISVIGFGSPDSR